MKQLHIHVQQIQGVCRNLNPGGKICISLTQQQGPSSNVVTPCLGALKTHRTEVKPRSSANSLKGYLTVKNGHVYQPENNRAKIWVFEKYQHTEYCLILCWLYAHSVFPPHRLHVGKGHTNMVLMSSYNQKIWNGPT